MTSFRRALEKLNVTGKILAADITPASPAFQLADVGAKVPPARRVEYIPALQDIVRQHQVGLLVPLTDLDLRSLARHREEFQQLGCTVMVGNESAVNLCRDKALTNDVIGRAGLATIRTVPLGVFMQEPFYPCFVKPISGSAGIGAAIIRNDKELRAHIAIFGDLLIVQEYVPGQEYTLDVYRTRAGQIVSVVPRQRLLVRSGEVEKGITVKDEQLISAGVRVGEELEGIWGVFCCQCRRSGSSPPRFFEINPRFGGGTPLSIAAGADLPLYLLQEVLGRPITAQVGSFIDRLLMLRYDHEVFLQVDENFETGYSAPQFH